MAQMTLATNGFEAYRKTALKAEFLSRMDTLVPWPECCAVIGPYYPKAGNGRSPIGLERMLRMYFIKLRTGLGMKVHIGADSRTGLTHSASVTPANVHDSRELPRLLHGNETRLYGDSAYTGQKEALKQVSPKAKDFTNKRARRNQPLSDADKETNRRKSRVRAKVEHNFRPLKSIYGSAKVRYRGLLKNANRAFALLALINVDKWGLPLTEQVRPA